LRIGEIRGLQWTDIKGGRLTVRRPVDPRNNVGTPKHDKARSRDHPCDSRHSPTPQTGLALYLQETAIEGPRRSDDAPGWSEFPESVRSEFLEPAITTLNALRRALADHADFATVTASRFDIALARAERRRSPRYAGRWRAGVLAWLLRVLGGGWTRRDLAELIIASATDFTRGHRPPCAAFVDGADVDALADRIKHMLARHK
jgi:hypothetical protein